MSDDKTTDGLPSSNLYDLTAPNNEYLTNIQSTLSTETEFFTIRIFSPISIHQNYENLSLTSKIEDIGDLHKVKIEKSKTYTEYVNSESLLLNLSDFLEEFLAKYFQISIFKPLLCELLLFVFPGEEYKEPMIKIIFPDNDDFNNLEIRDDIEEKFKQFLVNNSENLEEYKSLRNSQKKFRFVIQRE